MESKNHSIVDCFPYFNERELLELRVNLLKDYVDKFVIADANYTHSGQPKEYTLKRTIEELNLPKDKIEVIEVDLSEDNLPNADNYDEFYSPNSNKTSRERFHRDSLVQCLQTNNFSDNTLFIVSDCDEILNPKYIELYKRECYDNPGNIFKCDLVYLEGRADIRLYYAYNPNVPVDWDCSLFICNKTQFETISLTKIRGGFYDDILRWSYYDENYVKRDDKIKDVGWHFSWMGSNENRVIKSKAFCHYDQELDILKYKNYSDNQMQFFLSNYEFVEGDICPSGKLDMIIKKYPIENLPQIIFDLPRVKNFLLS